MWSMLSSQISLVFFMYRFHWYNVNDVNVCCRGTPSVMSRNIGGTSRRGQTYLMSQRTGNKGSSPRASLKAGNYEHNTVTLDDVKSVALDSMPDVEVFPEVFQVACRYCAIA